MQKIDVPLDGEYQSDSLTISNQTAVNCYINIPQTPSFAAVTLFGTPGIRQIATTGIIKQVNRGCHVKDGKFYFVNGTTAYRLDEVNNEFNIVALGEITGTARCSFADNGKQLMIVTDNDGWIIDETATPIFQKITDPDFKANGNPKQVVFIDGFFIVITDSKKFIRSAINNGLSYGALDFASAEADPDDIVSVVVNKNRLFIAGSETIEVFENLGLGGFPFQRINGFVIPKGCFSPFSMINIGESFMWIGGGENESPAIWELNGSSAQKVSNTAIDSELQAFSQSDLNEAFAYSYAQKGAFFVAFSFPSVTFVYDIVTGKWHERRSRVVDTKGIASKVRCRINSLATAYNRVICCDSQDGRVGVLDPDVYKEYDQPILREFSTITLFNQGNSFSIPHVELTMESGVGNEEQSEPEVRLAFSKDAQKFSNDIPRKVGKVGEFESRQIWRKLGRFARMAVIRFEFSDPCKFSALKLVIGIRNGR